MVDKLLNPGGTGLPDAAYEGLKLAEDPRYGKPCGSNQLAKTLAVYDRADPAAARVVIVAGSDFEGTSPKLFWPETLIYSLPGAELNQMLTLVVAIKSEMPCEPELLLFAGMNDHLHAMGLLEQLKGDEIPTSRKIWEAIQALFAAMNEVQENVVSRFGSKTKVVFTTSPGYANMPPALQFVYAVLILIAEGNEWRILMAAPNRELEPSNLRLRKSELAAAWADISHALRGFYGLADILIVLDEVLLLEISNFARQLKFSPVIGDDHPAISKLTASLWFWSMDVKITNSTSKSRGPSNERRNAAETEKQLESMKYRLTQENGWWPFLTPRLENATNKTREEAPPLVKQVWSFLEKQLELAETRDMTVARFVSAANEVTIGGFWREHAKGELKTRRDYEILKFLSPCWEKEFLAGIFGTTATIFGAFVQEILGMPISLLLALYLVYPRYLFNMGPAYMFSRGVETLRVDGYLALVLLTHGELVSFHRLMEYGEPLSMGRVHTSIETSSYKCAAGLKTLLVQYLMMQNRHMTGEDENPTSREEWKKTNRGMPLLTDLCLAMRSDPMGIIRGLEEVVTCIYGPAVTYPFPDPLVTTYRHSVTHLSLISILDGTALNWCQQEVLRGRMSNTVLFGKVKDAELIVYNFRGQMQCRMGGKREGPIEMYPKFWNLNPLTADGREILRIPAWKECFALVKRELETIMEKEILPATMPEFPIVRRMTLGMNSPLVVPSIMARMTTEEMQKDFTDGWDPLFIGYTAAVYFHTSETKVNSWTTQAKKSRGSQPPGYEVRKVLRTLEKEGLENMLPIWDDGRMIVMEGHVALVDDMKFATRKYKAPYGLEQVEIRQEGTELDAAGQLHVALTEYKKLDPTTPSPLSVDTPGDKRSGPVEDRFKKILERRRHESEEESMDETLSEAGEDMEVGNTPEPGPSGEELTTQELLKDLSEENWADTATPPLIPSPRKDLELPLASETFNMGMILLSSEEREKNTFEGNRDIFLGSLKDDAWQEFLEEFNQEVGSETTLDKFKEELWDTVVRFGEPLLIGTGLDEKARKELLSKLVELRNSRSKTREEKCEDSSTPKQKTVDKIVDDIKGDKVGTSNMIKSTNILKARAGGRQELEGLEVDREVESVMIATTPSSRDVKTDLCLAMRSDPMGIIRGLEEVVTCIYGPAVTYAFPDPLVTTYRHSVTHLSLISILDGTALNWCQQEVLRGRMSNTVLFGKVKDAELIVYNFRGQMQCRMGGKREGPIEMYPKFWNLNPLTADGREILRNPAWKECFALVKRELETIMEKEILPATMPEFPIVRRMTLGMNSPLVVPFNMGMILLSSEEREKNTFEGNRDIFLGSLKDDAWQEFLEEFNQEVGSETTLDKFKEELWDTVVRFGEPLLIGTGLDEKARKELLSKLVELRNSRSKTREEKCEDSSTPKQKTVDKIVDDIKRDKVGTSNMIKSTNILKARAGGRQELEGLEVDREVESVMIATTPSSRDVKTRKRKREVEGLGSPSVDAVSEESLRETAPMVLARCKTAAYKSSSELRRPLEVEKEIEASTSSTSEKDFKPQKINVKRGSTNGQTWEVDVGKEWISKAHQATGKQVTSDPLERK